VSALPNPDRFIVDLPAAEFADPALDRPIAVNQDGITGVRMAKQANGALRLVVDCSQAQTFQVMQLANNTLVVARAGRHHAALAALVRNGGAEGPAGGQDVAKVWAKESGERLTLHLGASKALKGGLQYVLSQAATDHLHIRVPRGRFSGPRLKPGRLLKVADSRLASDGWNLEIKLAEGHYELTETREKDGGVTLTWERTDPHRLPNRPLVIIDPGHGGADPGALGPGGKLEKTVCLALARTLRDTLVRRGYNAILTRGADAEVLLAPRLAMIERHKADVFVSLHANSHTTSDATGIETYFREPASQAFATTVQQTVTTLLHRPDRGTKQERLYVLRHPSVPSLLFEAGFISNPSEERLLDSPDFQAQTAFALATGIAGYLANAPLVGALPTEGRP